LRNRFFFSTILITLTLNISSLVPGEKLIFKIKYGFIGAGKAVLELNETTYRDSIPAYEIKSRAKTNSFFDKFFKVRDEIISTVDKDKFISYKFEKKLREGNYKQHRIHLYYPDLNLSYYLKYSRKSKKFKQTRMDIPENTQDILSAFYWFRKQEFTVGDTLSVNVTVDGRNTITKVAVHRLETIETIFGEKECFVIEPLLQTEAIFKQTGGVLIWLTRDTYKIPVQLESEVIFGHFHAILEKVENVTLD